MTSTVSQPAVAEMLTQATNATAPPPPTGAIGETLTCQWNGCMQPHHPSPEALYEHVCETHIGRKSTNNLTLQCGWGTCRTTTVKRDHITSHIRVHVPLKPHKCDFCGKSFKRPQDLKKHVKTHADESVLFNSPQANGNGRAPNGYQAPTNGKHGSFADGAGHGLGYPYGPAHGPYNGINAANLAPLYGFAGPQANFAGAALTESRKRTHDAMNDFFGQAKRRTLDPQQYQDLGAQFSQFLSMFAPMAAASGWGNGYNPAFAGGYDSGVAYQTQAAPPMNAYTTPFPELRTKNDLMSIDQFLEQLQNTVYDSGAEAASYQPIAGMQHGGFAFPRRSSNSPARFAGPQTAATPGAYSNNSFAASSSIDDTPALTPSSFQTGQSPQSSNRNLSPTSRPAGSSLYPTLPSFSSLDNQSNAFGGSIPPAGLGPQYEDFDGRRRYSGGHLQRARQSPPANEEVKEEEKDNKLAEGVKEVNISSPSQKNVKLPSLSEITRDDSERASERSSEPKSEKDERTEAHQLNVKTITAMRDYIRQRLTRGDFERDSDSEDGNRTPRASSRDVEMKDDDSEQATTPKREGASLYPALRPVEA